MAFKLKYLFLLLLFISSCKSAKKITQNNSKIPIISTKELLKKTTKKTPNFKTLAGRLKIEYQENNESKSVTVSFRMEKNKTIWLSKLGIVKALVTPNRVAFYNTLENEYFDGTFNYLSELLGTPLNFNALQNVLLGTPIISLKENQLQLEIINKNYVLNQTDAFKNIFFKYFIDGKNYTLKKEKITQTNASKSLEILYLEYQEIDLQTIPKKITLIASEKEDKTTINLEFKGLKRNENLRFPFKIPSGYKKIELE